MTKAIFKSVFLFVMAVGLLALPLNEAAAQAWKSVTIQYEDSKNQGILTGVYRIVRQKRGCRLTIRLTNKTEEKISHYWFKFNFKEGHEHENRMTDHLPGDSQELTYSSCGVPRVHISEVELKK